jgi:hypothetical protein
VRRGFGADAKQIGSQRRLKRASSRLAANAGQARPANAGQATVEYILLLSFVVVACVGMTRAILGGIDKGVLRVGGGLEKQLKTGRAPGGIWSN